MIPTAGRPLDVMRAVASALAQTMPDLEVVVTVDGEDPATISGLSSIDDPRLRWIVHPVRRGARAARDTGISAGRGRWIAFLDDDDIWLPAKLERQLAAVPTGDALVTTCFRVRSPLGDLIKPGRPYEGAEPFDEWLFDRHSWFAGGEAMFQTSGLMAPRTLFQQMSFASLGQHEDWELGLRAVKQFGLPLVTVPEPLVIYHTGDGPSLSDANRCAGSREWIDGLRNLVTPRAYSGFCLTVAAQSLDGGGRLRQAAGLLLAAFRHGRPTARQLFAFLMIVAVPHGLRKKLRASGANAGTDS